jgi:hypothetical protein
MELRQLKYFLKVVECGSLGKAALELDVGASALSQQITKLENELSTRLLKKSVLVDMSVLACLLLLLLFWLYRLFEP